MIVNVVVTDLDLAAPESYLQNEDRVRERERERKRYGEKKAQIKGRTQS